ncbi:MAG: NAD(P)-dependent oxidoreductase [Methanomicrobiales archaeon]|nr:NAD(P)-dependent oxidoreductase [Methanomicrobiales archaeon]
MKSEGEFFRDRSILITGASGFIGQHLLKEFKKYTTSLAVIQRNKIPIEAVDLPIRQFACDIGNRRDLHSCLTQCDPEIIVHLAGYKERNTNLLGFSEGLNTNVMGSLNIFSEALDKEHLESMVVLGTAEEYGNNPCPYLETMRESPVSPYSFSKTCISHMALLFNSLYQLPITVLRPTLAYGPGQENDMFLPSLISSLHRNRAFRMTTGEQTRDFLYIDDLIDAILRVPRYPGSRGHIINIGSGMPVKIIDIAYLVEKLMKKKNLIHSGQVPYRDNEIMKYCVDIGKAVTVLHWKPRVSLHAGLTKTIHSITKS